MADETLTRRGVVRGLTCCAGLPVAAAAGAAQAQDAAPASRSRTAPAGKDLTPDQALQLLKDGNANFEMEAPYRAVATRERRLEIAAGQQPFAVLVGCSDSRTSPELLFGRGLGELFIIRIAGNTVDQAAQGSVEYAVAELGVPLIVVLGHERCGAVHAAVEVVESNASYPGSINEMIAPIIPAVLAVQDAEGDLLDNAVRSNVRRVVEGLKTSSSILAGPVASGDLKVVGAYYDLEDGTVEFLED